MKVVQLHELWSSRKKVERSICLGLVVAARQIRLDKKILNLTENMVNPRFN